MTPKKAVRYWMKNIKEKQYPDDFTQKDLLIVRQKQIFLTLLYVESNIQDYNTKVIYPEVTRICYHLLQDVHLFLNTPQGKQLLSDVNDKKVLKVVFVPLEPYPIKYYEKNIFSKIKHIFDNKKFSIYCTDFLSNDFKNISYGFIVLQKDEIYSYKC